MKSLIRSLNVLANNTSFTKKHNLLFSNSRGFVFLLLSFALTSCLEAQWVQQGGDIDGEAAGDNSGRSVSLSSDGQTVAIGAVGNGGNGYISGHVRIYKLISGVWTQLGMDIDGEGANSASGFSVSLSSDGLTVAIGATFNSGNGLRSGHIRVFKLVNGVWTQQGLDIDGEAADDRFGCSVSLSSDGQTVAAGANFNGGNGYRSGHVRVYKFMNGVWTQQGLDIDGEAAEDQSGSSVSLSSDGQAVAIGAPFNDGNGYRSGQVRIYKFVNGVWTQQGLDIDGEAANDVSGHSVSLSSDGQIVAIGAIGNSGNLYGSGHVRVYKLMNGVWTQQGLDIDGESGPDIQNSGWSVSLSSDGQTVAIGAPGNNKGRGHVRVFTIMNGNWIQQSSDIDGEIIGDRSGTSVSLSSDAQTVAIGAPSNDGNGNNSGQVRVYKYAGPPEINVTGNNLNIPNNDTSPDPSDNTDFGIVTTSTGLKADTFSIENAGPGALTIPAGGITLTGAHAADFALSGISLPATIPAGNNTIFIVSFTPSASGLRTASISIVNNDSDENPYTFSVQGYGTASPDQPWSQSGMDIDGEADDDLSGRSVSLSVDGQTIAIGAPLNDGGGNNSGQVRVFNLLGEVWTQLGSDIDGEHPGDEAGYSVSLSSDGQTVAIGEHFNADNGTNSGQVRVFKLIGGIWTQQGSDLNGAAAFDQFGYSVSLSSDGQTVAIGAIENDGNGPNTGEVQVYKLIGGVWTQQGSDINGEGLSDWLGWSVSLSSDGQTVAIGAPRNGGNGSNAGHVRVYKLIGGVWIQQGSDIDGEAAGDEFGYSVSLSADGQTVAAGAKGNDGNGGDSGHARVFQLSGGVWTQLGADIDGEAPNDFSGSSVSLSPDGQTLAVAAYGNDGGGSQSGHIRVYKLLGSVWTKQGADLDGEAAGDQLGWSVSLSADGLTIAAGGPFNDGNGNDSGHARIFRLNAPAQIDLGSNGNPIENRSNAPGTSNGTDFGAAATGSSVSHLFSIGNTYAAKPLLLSGTPLVTIVGQNPADFIVTIPPPASVPAGSGASFTIEFKPQPDNPNNPTPNLRTATVIITHNDLPENPFTFSVQGMRL
ncbi:MAG: choice-of-anchor D domain-containing protein [Lewinellaceae bacterium]|nr:choice-of-anchor D domain-containing protein [Lewinellaceae bacterium]